MPSKGITFIDLFAGIGGFRLALEEFGLNCVFSSEIDPECREVYKENFGSYPAGDITKLKPKDIPAHNILCGGFPCQPFSISGKKLGFEDTRGTLFFDIANIVKHHRPRIIFLENVRNLVGHDKGNTLLTIVNTLEDMNYKVFTSVLNASNFGVPTARQRLYIVAFHASMKINNFEFPSGSNKKINLQSFLCKDVDKKYMIQRDDIILNDIQLKTIQNKPVRVGSLSLGRQGERIYSAEWGHAITFSASGGGIGSTSGLYLTKEGIVRKLSPKECYKIMGFPKNYILSQQEKQAYKQIGNSVAIPVIKTIYKQINHAIVERSLHQCHN